MKNELSVEQGLVIPENELEITTSRSGGPGGQHVNKTNTRITVRWNVPQTSVLNDEQKERVMQKLASQLTLEGDLIVHHSASRSQQQNKKMACAQLNKLVKKALFVPKKRMATRVSKGAKEERLRAKTHRSSLKELRSRKIDY